MNSQILTVPGSVTFGAQEQFAVGIDCTNELAGYPSAVPASPVVSVVDNRTAAVITLPSPVVIGMVVSQPIPRGSLAAGHTYQLTLAYSPSTSGDILEAVLQIVVPGFS